MTTLRRFAKAAVFGSYSMTIAPMRSQQLAATRSQRLSVLCYHRVNDKLRDNVTLPVDLFDRQMAFLRQRYTVISVRDIVSGNYDRTETRPIVAVTFDDGYLDNYQNAFPILTKHAIPAAFFVSTGSIGTDLGFQHDRDSLGEILPSMTWDQLREMHAAGHEIGSHTVHHINLAKVGEPIARQELAASRETLRQELGIKDVAFAYCFGGRRDITPARRSLVRELGYTCCFSAYGGTNAKAIDLFDIRRFGVNWAYTQPAFQARIEGWPDRPRD